MREAIKHQNCQQNLVEKKCSYFKLVLAKNKIRSISMTVAEKLITKKLQDKFNGFIEKISFSLTKPEKKFLKAVCFGILSSRSCIVRRTAQSLKINIKSVGKETKLGYRFYPQPGIRLSAGISSCIIQTGGCD